MMRKVNAKIVPTVHSANFLIRHRNRVLLATAHAEDVTCLRCKYWLRWYIPLSRLAEHQAWQRLCDP